MKPIASIYNFEGGQGDNTRDLCIFCFGAIKHQNRFYSGWYPRGIPINRRPKLKEYSHIILEIKK